MKWIVKKSALEATPALPQREREDRERKHSVVKSEKGRHRKTVGEKKRSRKVDLTQKIRQISSYGLFIVGLFSQPWIGSGSFLRTFPSLKGATFK